MTSRPAARRRPARAGPGAGAWALALAVALAGCNGFGREGPDLAARLQQARQDNDRLREEGRRLRRELADRDKQIADLRRLGEKRLDLLFHVEGIRLRRTSGVDLDETPGDDAVRVYLRPVDAEGHPIKAAGDVTVQLFDLAAAEDRNLLGRYEFPVKEISDHWYSGFMTYHYRFDCRWDRPPAHPKVTVRVVFLDYLTGREHAAQTVVHVRLPAPTTRPAG